MALAAHGITSEGAVSLDGDMPRYLMNGVLMHDVLLDLPLRHPLEYAQHYFARYPALSLGHHPLLPAAVIVPFYVLFGISVFSARLSTVCAAGVLLFFWFRLIREIYDLQTAVFASLLLLSTPGLIPLFQVVLSEPITLSLIVASVYFMHRYCTTQRRVYAVAFVVSVIMTGYAKQLAVLMFPVYAFQFARAFGVRRLFARSTLLAAAAIGVCLLPLVPLTLKYSPFNVTIVTQWVTPGGRVSRDNFAHFLNGLTRGALGMTAPLLALAMVSVIAAAVKRDRRALLFVVWVAVWYAGLVTLGVENDRFLVYWLPAFCALAAASLHAGSGTRWRTVAIVLLLGTFSYQRWLEARASETTSSSAPRPAGGLGYEAAARYVTEHPIGDTILYSAAIDTGYFVFFVRKHDPGRQAIVLRADKILTTSRMLELNFANRTNRPEEIEPLLQRFGVGYVVIEDRRYPAGPLSWLGELVQTSDFSLRQRINIESRDLRMTGATLSIYEYLARTPADADATLTMDIPLMNDRIEVPLADLIGRRAEETRQVSPIGSTR
jgi:hypothetical protein